MVLKSRSCVMGTFVRHQTPVVVALGAGVLLGAGVTVIYYKVTSSLSKQLDSLVVKVDHLKQDLDLIKRQFGVENNVGGGLRGYHSTSSGDEEDVYEDAYGGSTWDLARPSSLTSSGDEYLSATSNGGIESGADLTQVFGYVDKLFEGKDSEKEQAFNMLQDRQRQHIKNPEFLWRLSKAAYFVSQIEGGKGNEDRKKSLIYLSNQHATKALNYDKDSSNVHKWFAITLGSVGDYETTQVKIQNGFTFKQHIVKGIEINPRDPSLHYLLGRWCYGVYMITWIERKVAATLFGSPPSATVDEALNHFLEAENLNPGAWKENCLYIAKCYVEKSDYYTGMEWLDKANSLPTVSQDDRTSQTEIDGLLYKYSGYRR